MLVDTDTEQRNTQTFTLSNLRFEPESDGYITVWFDLGGPAFEEPEAMTNMFVEFDELLKHLSQHHPAMYEVLADGSPGHSAWLERLEAADFDWNEHLLTYIDRNLDIRAMEKERISWLLARRAREEGPATQVQFDADWQRLSAQAEPVPHPSWDDVAHAFINSLNNTAVELYPELLDYNEDGNNRLRDMIESHGERLANQLVALTKSVRNEQVDLKK